VTAPKRLAPADDPYERPMSADEVKRWLARPIPADEAEAVADLVRWFTRRYPTGQERLAYVRRAFARWSRA